MHFSSVAVISGLLVGSSYAASVPANVKNFYDSIRAKGSCSNKLKSGFTAIDGGSNSFSYCGDHMADYNVMYIQGTGGALADMDIDCDGQQGDPLDDGRCGSSKDTQGETAFKSTVAGYKKGISDLNSFAHPYVVFGNEGTKSGYVTFDPRSYGVEPLSIIAVVCNNQLFYGVWGDTNGDDDVHAMVGEASISLATLCFGKSMNGDNGYSNTDVLYIAFPGSEAVPGANGAAWGADNVATFENSLQALGNKLISRIGGSSPVPTSTGLPPTPSSTCSWAGHCAGASCSSDNDCSDALTCQNGKCGGSSPAPSPTPSPSPSCSWAGHCAGASCSSDNDCSDSLTCQSGKCSGSSTPAPTCSWAGHCAGASCSTGDDCSDALTCQNGVCA